MDTTEDHSCALENFPSTYLDVSKLSDTLPSLSIDESNIDHDFFLKEHYDKMDRLRTENFNLKLKLYMLESDEKLTNDSELKFKVLNEFEKKNEEIKNLKDMVKKQSKENGQLKKAIKGRDDNKVSDDVYQENEQLKKKLSDTIQICSELVLNTEQLIQLQNTDGLNKDNLDRLNTSQACLDKATRFLSDASFAQLDSSGILKRALNRKTKSTSSDTVQAIKSADSAAVALSSQHHQSATASQNGQISVNRPESDHEKIIIKDFMEVVGSLHSLIDDFRANRVTYKDFSTKLDGLFEALEKQYRSLEKLQLSRLENATRLKSAERMLKNEAAIKERIKSDLARSMKKLESMISKTKQTA